MLSSEIMRLLPEAREGERLLSTPEVHRRLCGLMPETPVVKTVQRHLLRMQEEGLVESEKRGTAWFWGRRPGASGMAAKAGAMMTRDEALALHALRQFAFRQIPVLVARALSPLFDVARDRLDVVHNEGERRYQKWFDKIAVESGSFALHHPEIDAAIFSQVSQALFYEHQLEIAYRARSRDGMEGVRVVMPLGLVECAGLVYLVAGTEKYANPAMYRLDRLRQARMLPQAFPYPRGFKLETYVKQQRQFDFHVEGKVKLRLRFRQGAGDHLRETPLSLDQQVSSQGECLEVRGTVLLSQRLRWWLRSFGPNVEVLEPRSLRDELAAEAKALARIYKA